MLKIHYSDEDISSPKSPAIFLAGPTPRTAEVPSWRPKAIELFKHQGFEGSIFIPEAQSGVYTSYIHQVEWEFHHLEKADKILFWIPRNLKTMPAFTTNVEFGLYVKSGKIIYARPDSAPKNKYLDALYQKFNDTPIFDSLEAAIASIQ